MLKGEKMNEQLSGGYEESIENKDESIENDPQYGKYFEALSGIERVK